MSDVLSALQSIPCDALIATMDAAGYAIQADRRFGDALCELVDTEMNRRISLEDGAEPLDVQPLDFSKLTLGDIRRAGLAVDAVSVPGAESFLVALKSALQRETGLRVRSTCRSGRCGMRRKVTA